MNFSAIFSMLKSFNFDFSMGPDTDIKINMKNDKIKGEIGVQRPTNGPVKLIFDFNKTEHPPKEEIISE